MEAFSPATLGDLALQDFKKITCEDAKIQITIPMSFPNVLLYKACSLLSVIFLIPNSRYFIKRELLKNEQNIKKS
jgi:hypothetical protein